MAVVIGWSGRMLTVVSMWAEKVDRVDRYQFAVDGTMHQLSQ